MKRVVGSSVFALFLLLLIAAGYFYFQAKRDDRGSVLMAVPSDALFLLTCHPGSGELRQFGQTDFFKSDDENDWEYKASHVLSELDSLAANNEKWSRIFDQSPLYLSGHHSGNGEVGVIYYFSIHQAVVASLDKLCFSLVKAKDAVRLRRSGQVEIHDLVTRDGRSFSWTISQGVFMCTFTPYLLEDALRQQAQELSSTMVTTMPDFIQESANSLTLAVRYSFVTRFLDTQLKSDAKRLLKPLSRFGEWTILSLEISGQSLAFHGQTLPADTFSFVRLFTTQRPVKWTVIRNLPVNTLSCIAWAMDDPADFIQQLNRDGVAGNPEDVRLRDHFKPWVGQEIAMVVQRQFTDSVRDQPIALFRIRNEQACRSYLRLLEGESGSREETYLGIPIRLIQRPGILKSVFGPVFEPVNRFYYSIIDGYLVVANQASALRGFIDAYKSGNRLVGDPRFLLAFSKIPEKGNTLFFVDLSKYERNAPGFLKDKTNDWIPQVASSAHRLGIFLFSMHQSNGIFLTQGVLEHIGENRDSTHLQQPAPSDSVQENTLPSEF